MEQIQDNILVQLIDLQSKLTQIKDFNCHILCLKMLDRIVSLRPDAFECYYQCTLQISKQIASLPDQDKELFFMAVKRITKMIKANMGRQDVEMTTCVDVDSDTEPAVYYKTPDGSFKQKESRSPTNLKYSLQQLKHLLRPSVIQHYPKIALLAFDAFSEYMTIFDNPFCSLYSLCTERYEQAKVS